VQGRIHPHRNPLDVSVTISNRIAPVLTSRRGPSCSAQPRSTPVESRPVTTGLLCPPLWQIWLDTRTISAPAFENVPADLEKVLITCQVAQAQRTLVALLAQQGFDFLLATVNPDSPAG
jgi:hypothetical protein